MARRFRSFWFLNLLTGALLFVGAAFVSLFVWFWIDMPAGENKTSLGLSLVLSLGLLFIGVAFGIIVALICKTDPNA